jgi:hypothetical protein
MGPVWKLRVLGGLVVLTFSMVVGCSSSETKRTEKVPDQWQGDMQVLSQTLTELFPLLANKKEFEDPKNASKIDAATQRLVKLSHDVSNDKMQEKLSQVDVDPSLKLIAANFRREITTATDAWRVGNREYARISLRNVSSMCIQCHSRGEHGPKFASWVDEKQFTYLSRLERAELNAAVRRFDEALLIYQQILDDPNAFQPGSWDWERAAKNALNIAVRVKQDPVMAMSIVDKIINTSNAARFFKSDAREWKVFIQRWKSEGKSKLDELAQGRRLVNEARTQNIYPASRATYVLYLRASALLHNYLRKPAKASSEAEAFYLLGQSYAALREPNEANLEDFYYKACIFKVPHTEQALKCFERFQENQFLDAFGERQMLPSSTLDYLKYLEDAATPGVK